MNTASKVSAIAFCLVAPLSQAADFSFTGSFTQDDEVQLFTFSVGATSDVTLRSYSYAGGVNAAGTTIPRGGFDPILALFGSSGLFIDEQDDAECPNVPADAVTGTCYDVKFTTTSLAAGNYTVSLMEFDNFSVGPNLSNGFDRAGDGNFTAADFGPTGATGPFWDVNEDQRDGHWAFDILGVAAASLPGPSQVPEPNILALLGIALGGLGFRRQKRAVK